MLSKIKISAILKLQFDYNSLNFSTHFPKKLILLNEKNPITSQSRGRVGSGEEKDGKNNFFATTYVPLLLSNISSL